MQNKYFRRWLGSLYGCLPTPKRYRHVWIALASVSAVLFIVPGWATQVCKGTLLLGADASLPLDCAAHSAYYYGAFFVVFRCIVPMLLGLVSVSGLGLAVIGEGSDRLDQQLLG